MESAKTKRKPGSRTRKAPQKPPSPPPQTSYVASILGLPSDGSKTGSGPQNKSVVARVSIKYDGRSGQVGGLSKIVFPEKNSGGEIPFKRSIDLVKLIPSSGVSLPQLKNLLSCSKIRQPKKVYVPNLNVVRNKNAGNQSTSQGDRKLKTERQRRQNTQGRNKAMIQTQGVFSAGLGKSDVTRSKGRFRDYEDQPPAKRACTSASSGTGSSGGSKKTVDDITHAKTSFMDVDEDDDSQPDVSDAPACLPLYRDVAEKTSKFDVDSLFNYINHSTEEALPVPEPTHKKALATMLSEPTETPKLLLFDFPHSFPFEDDDDDTGKPPKKPQFSLVRDEEPVISPLKKLKSGLWGKLQIRANGDMSLVCGNIRMKLHSVNLPDTRVVVSTINPSTGRGKFTNVGRLAGGMAMELPESTYSTPLKS